MQGVDALSCRLLDLRARLQVGPIIQQRHCLHMTNSNTTASGVKATSTHFSGSALEEREAPFPTSPTSRTPVASPPAFHLILPSSRGSHCASSSGMIYTDVLCASSNSSSEKSVRNGPGCNWSKQPDTPKVGLAANCLTLHHRRYSEIGRSILVAVTVIWVSKRNI